MKTEYFWCGCRGNLTLITLGSEGVNFGSLSEVSLLNLLSSGQYLKLEDVTNNFKFPCILDVKIGRVTWDQTADQEKINSRRRKWPLQNTLGFSILGFRVGSCNIVLWGAGVSVTGLLFVEIIVNMQPTPQGAKHQRYRAADPEFYEEGFKFVSAEGTTS